MIGLVRVTVWNEYRHEKQNPAVASIYPEGIHNVIASYLSANGFVTNTATLEEPEHGLTESVLDRTDVLIWWGHLAHGEVDDLIVERLYHRVLAGMGLVVLHSGHGSKLFSKLLGTPTGQLKWREANDKERIWVVNPAHPIASGIGEYIELPMEEMYGEHFNIPSPDELIFISWFEGGEVFRSGVTYQRGRGKIFYFRPGHETYPTYHNEGILRVIANGALWAVPSHAAEPVYGNAMPLEPISSK
jgi:trehalose utilization protein